MAASACAPSCSSAPTAPPRRCERPPACATTPPRMTTPAW
ncbi:Uncharacterised protein [Bordetella pertussis]|nr:Uncharacterised protein [Bordetella pertussis]